MDDPSLCHNLLGLIDSLPNVKILDLSKLKVFADNKINGTHRKSSLVRIENIVGKGEHAGYQHFLLFLQCFQKAIDLRYQGFLKSGLCCRVKSPVHRGWLIY